MPMFNDEMLKSNHLVVILVGEIHFSWIAPDHLRAWAQVADLKIPQAMEVDDKEEQVLSEGTGSIIIMNSKNISRKPWYFAQWFLGGIL